MTNPAFDLEMRAYLLMDDSIHRVCPAESLSMGDESVQLLGSKAAHWFDIPAFFTEVYRVLAPGGVCALFNCKLVPSAFPSLSPQDEVQLMDVVKWVSFGRVSSGLDCLSLGRGQSEWFEFYQYECSSIIVVSGMLSRGNSALC